VVSAGVATTADPADGLVKELVASVPGHTVLVALGSDVTESVRLAVVREVPATLLVVRSGQTKRAQLIGVVGQLESVGGAVLGSVLVPRGGSAPDVSVEAPAAVKV